MDSNNKYNKRIEHNNYDKVSGNNAINITQDALPFLFFFSMSHTTNIEVIYIMMEF